MPDPRRFVSIELRPCEWEVIIASVLYATKMLKEDPDMQFLLPMTPRTLALVKSMEHQIACDEEEHAAQD